VAASCVRSEHVSEPLGPSIDITTRLDLLVLRPLQLLVLPYVDQPDDERQHGHEEAQGGVRAPTRHVLGRRGRRVHVRPVDRGRVADHVADGDDRGALDHRPGERVGDPREDDLVRRHRAHGHEEHGEEARGRVRRRRGDDVADRRDQHQGDDVDGPVAGPSGRVRDQERHEERREPHGHGQQEGLDVPVAQGVDDRREEVLERLRQERRVLEQDEQVHAVVLEGQLQPFHDRRGLGVVGFLGVVDEPPLRKGPFLLIQPPHGGWKVGKNKSGCYELLLVHFLRNQAYPAIIATPMVITPSTMKSHLHPAIPCAPSRFPRIPAPRRPPNIFASALPE